MLHATEILVESGLGNKRKNTINPGYNVIFGNLFLSVC